MTDLKREERVANNIKTIAIDSDWGKGKTFFTRAILEKLDDKGDYNTIYYDASKSDFYKDPLITILSEIALSLDIGNEIEKTIQNKIENFVKGTGKLLGKMLGKKLGIDEEFSKILVDMLASSNDIKFFDEYKNYKSNIEGLKQNLEELSENKKQVIFIDNLDRCVPSFAIEVLEAIKHFFDVEGIIFVFLVNKKVLNSVVENIYGKINNNESYFQKFFDFTFRLPELDIDEYLKVDYKHGEKVEELMEKDDIDGINKYLFLTLISLLEKEYMPTAREIIKLEKKFKLLLMTMEKDKKRNIAYSLLLISYFLYKELDKNNLILEEWAKKAFNLEVHKNNKLFVDIGKINLKNNIKLMYERVYNYLIMKGEIINIGNSIQSRKVKLELKIQTTLRLESTVFYSGLKNIGGSEFIILIPANNQRIIEKSELIELLENKYSFLGSIE